MDLGNKLKSVAVTNSDEFELSILFEGGETYQISLASFFDPPKGLAKDIVVGQLFDHCFVTPSGALGWPNGIEFCPDMLKMLAKEQSGEAA